MTLEHRDPGGPAAIRGYRLQVVYALDLLSSVAPRLRLEGEEDIDLLGPQGNVLEAIQVKAISSPLALSLLKSKTGGTNFFKRLATLHAREPDIRGEIVSFGEVGPELLGAFEGDTTHRTAVVEKLRDDYDVAQPEVLLGRVGLVQATETQLYDRLARRLTDLCPAATPETSIRLLASWLLLCAETRSVVTRQDLDRQLEAAGLFATECRAYAAEWFHTINALSSRGAPDVDALAEEFYQGIAARFDHIAAGVDVERAKLVGRIEEAFGRARIVVLHGASGEGKSTLLLRYAEDFARLRYRYLVDIDADLTRTLSISSALGAFARNSGRDVLLLLDVRPGNRHWQSIVEALAPLQNVNVLIGIREEDWREASALSYRLRLEDVAVRLEEEEACEVFLQLQRTHATTSFVSFHDAWEAFGGAGPMLEFVHLITKHQSLKARLREQAQRLLSELPEPQAQFARLAACATGYGGRVSVAGLTNTVGIGPAQAMALISRLEEEYFIRRSPGGEWLEPVHPIRSRILCELVFDDTLAPLVNAMTTATRLIHDDDLERFIFESFLLLNAGDVIAREAARLVDGRPASWSACAAIARGLLWLDVSTYADSIRPLVTVAKAVMPGAWRFLLPWTFSPGWSDDETEAVTNLRRTLLKNYPELLAIADGLAEAIPPLRYNHLSPFLNILALVADHRNLAT